jgi:EAL domain-containing protein (putative c-di-GMP-specific phosphodiesterase class I)
VGAEALARWHPETGVHEIGEIIRLAERTGLIASFDRLIYRQVGQALLSGQLGTGMTCSVNASAHEVASGLIVHEMKDLLHATSLDPARLTVEITETAVLSDPRAAARHLSELAALGVRIALDDFGTGFSSLEHLLRLPLHFVKLHRSFITDVHTRPRASELVRAVVNMGTKLGFSVIAEGVETTAQADALRELGCPFAQGYLYGAAVPLNEFSTTSRA